jgi:hypothetical protein
MDEQQQLSQYTCFDAVFSTTHKMRVDAPILKHNLNEIQSIALGNMMQILCCGEESAILAFDGLSKRNHLIPNSQNTLAQIAQDEMRHDQLLWNMGKSLLPVDKDIYLLRKIKRFFISIATEDIGLHFSKIAALDSAVCAILSALTRSQTVIGHNHELRSVFSSIHRDEARHVAITLDLACELSNRDERMYHALLTRNGLRSILELRADSLEKLGVDTIRLDRDLAQLPRSFAA